MPHPALLAISHGTGDRAGQRAVAALVDAVAARLPDVEVRLGHVDVQRPDVASSLAALADRPVVLVPLLLSAGYHLHVDLRRATADRSAVTVAGALGPDPRLADVLAARLAQARLAQARLAQARLAQPGLASGAEVVLAVAGSSDERANDDCREVARLLAERLGRPVRVGFLAAAEPRLAEAVAASPHGAVVASYLLAPGYFHDLAAKTAAGATVARPLLDDDPPAPQLVDLVVDRYLAARRSARSHLPAPRNRVSPYDRG